MIVVWRWLTTACRASCVDKTFRSRKRISSNVRQAVLAVHRSIDWFLSRRLYSIVDY